MSLKPSGIHRFAVKFCSKEEMLKKNPWALSIITGEKKSDFSKDNQAGFWGMVSETALEGTWKD